MRFLPESADQERFAGRSLLPAIARFPHSTGRAVEFLTRSWFELREGHFGERLSKPTSQVFGTSLELSDAATRTITRHELSTALARPDALPHIVGVFMDHARDLASKRGPHVLVVAPPPEVFALGDIRRTPAVV